MSHLLSRAQLIFWDFDGVIKESVEVKTAAFAALFAPFGKSVVDQVVAHHEAHGGVSRFEKIPLYLAWAGQDSDAGQVAGYAEEFSALVLQAVLDAPWVPGARAYLQDHYTKQRFVLVSATPQEEMEIIADNLKMSSFFEGIYGAPAKKADVIRSILVQTATPKAGAIMVGDSATDMEAAQANGILFVLRRTVLNRDLQAVYSGPQTDDFIL